MSLERNQTEHNKVEDQVSNDYSSSLGMAHRVVQFDFVLPKTLNVLADNGPV